MDLERLFSLTLSGVPVALWLFVAAVAVVAIALSFVLLGRPAVAPSRSR